MTMVAALNATLRDALTNDPSVVIFGEDVGVLGGVFRVTDGLQAQFGDKRVWDSPLGESGIVGAAIGMAMYGLRPVVEMQFDAFSYPAFNQIVSHMAKMHNRTKGRVRLPIVVRIPYGGAVGALEHHSDSSEAYWTHTAGLTVLTPSNSEDAYHLLRDAVGSDDPVIFLEPKSRYWQANHDDLVYLPPDKARVVREGTDMSLLAYGASVQVAAEVANIAAGHQLSIEIVDIRSLAPLDEVTIVESVMRTRRVGVLQESQGFGGYGAEVAARISHLCFDVLEAPVLRIAGWDTPYPPPRLERFYLPTVERVLDSIDRWSS